MSSQGRFVDHRAAGEIEQNGVGLHGGKADGPDQAARLLRQRDGQDQDVGCGKELIQGRQRMHPLIACVRPRKEVHAEDAGVKGPEAARAFRSDAAAADDQDGFAGQLA